jgi:hypothetical protein
MPSPQPATLVVAVDSQEGRVEFRCFVSVTGAQPVVNLKLRRCLMGGYSIDEWMTHDSDEKSRLRKLLVGAWLKTLTTVSELLKMHVYLLYR